MKENSQDKNYQCIAKPIFLSSCSINSKIEVSLIDDPSYGNNFKYNNVFKFT